MWWGQGHKESTGAIKVVNVGSPWVGHLRMKLGG